MLLLIAASLTFFGAPMRAAFTVTAPPGTFEAAAEVSLARNDLAERKTVEVASAQAGVDGSLDLHFEGEPGLYLLRSAGQLELPLAPAEGQSLHIARDADAPAGYRVEGSPDTELAHQYEAFRKESLGRLVHPPRAAANKAKAERADEHTLAELTRAEVEGYRQHLRELNDFVLAQVGPSIALYATSIRWNADYRGEEIETLVDAFSAQHGEIAIAKQMRERIQAARRVAIGSEAPELVAENLEGVEQRLSDFRGDYVLVDFWASWCLPCRTEHKHYRKLAERDGKSPITILGVNLDTTKNAWQRAVRQDQVTWPQISDLEGLNSPLAAAYNVSALPRSVLVDPEGRIIAKDLRGEALDRKLEELGLLGN